MSDVINPAEDTWVAVKNRTAGPIGTFILIWSMSHWKIVSFILFDAVGKSDLPQAQAKISAISELIANESLQFLLLYPIILTVVVLIIGQAIALAWHFISDQFRYLKERVSYKNDMRIYLHRRFGKNPDDLLATIRSEVTSAMADVSNIPRAGEHISAANELGKLQATVSSVNQRATDISNKMKDVLKLLELADEKPLITHVRSLMKKTLP